jgi:Hint domain
MQELEAHLTKAQFARRHLSKMAGIGLAALIARVAMPKPAKAQDNDENEPDADDRRCFLKGTRIRTVAGERKVEDLAIGDLLPTHFNGIQPIQWIGRYRYTRSDVSKPWVRDALPVRIARSALAPNVPHSDLYVTQPHAIFTDGALVRVWSLVNGATIALHDAGDLSELEYYHIKLQSHDIVYAEGAPCETLLDVNENALNFVEYLRMYGAPSEKAHPCTPVLNFAGGRSKMKSRLRSALSPWVDRREQIDIIRDRLEDRALTMV